MPNREVEIINAILEMLSEFDSEAQERIVSYIQGRLETDWYIDE